MDSLLRKFDPGSTHSLFSTLFWCFRHQVLVKGYVDVVVIVCGSEEIARHRRSYGREELIFDPLHHLALLERKTGALDQAAPLTGWALPDEFLRDPAGQSRDPRVCAGLAAPRGLSAGPRPRRYPGRPA